MEVSVPEHRIYTVLACFQVAFVMVGTFAIRVATSESFFVPADSVPWYAYAVRNWGYFLLLVPVGFLVWALRDIKKDPDGHHSGIRILIGIVLTVFLGVLLWQIWDHATILSHSHMEVLEVL